MKPAVILLIMVLLLPLRAAAQDIGTVTLLEQRLRVIRGTTVLLGGEGVRLRQGDIIETSNAGFAQLEFRGGAVVALGPVSRLFLLRQGVEGSAAELVLLSGWLKGESAANTAARRYHSPLLSASTSNGTVVLHADTGMSEIFIESGAAEVNEVSRDGNLLRPIRAKAGQFFVRRAGKDTVASPRPNSAFLQTVPVPFRDTLPSRLARFAKAVEPKRDHEVTYAEIQPWLNIGRSWRRDFVERFQQRLKDSDFRQALEDDLSDHPEWGPVLHPEKLEPGSPQAAISKSNSVEIR